MQGGRFFCEQHKLVEICNTFEHLAAVAPVINPRRIHPSFVDVNTKYTRFFFVFLVDSVFCKVTIHGYRPALF